MKFGGVALLKQLRSISPRIFNTCYVRGGKTTWEADSSVIIDLGNPFHRSRASQSVSVLYIVHRQRHNVKVGELAYKRPRALKYWFQLLSVTIRR
jgi:hypothetical protein